MEELEPQLGVAIAQFNRGDYYACHDSLEALWHDAPLPERNFYQGLLQVAVGLYHRDQQNLPGAMLLLGEGIGRLRRYLPEHSGVDTEQLVRSATALLAALQRGDSGETPRLVSLGTGEDVPGLGKGDIIKP
jgi:predicted metal-dependent hydrolase